MRKLLKPLSLSLVALCILLLVLLGARIIDPLIFWIAIGLIGAFAHFILPRLTRS